MGAKLALEIHDLALTALAGDDPHLRVESPGVALWDGQRLMVGASAEGRSRLRPKDVHRRFWQELSLAPLGPPFPESWTVAELVHAHLEAVWQEAHDGVESVLVVASGAFSGKQLGLLLGIARSLKIPVRGLVDTALSAALPVAFELPHRRLLHLDLHQHRAVLTEIERHREVARGRIEIDDSLGWATLQDVWARHIAGVFIEATRFDPLYDASLEQILYHQMVRWLEEIKGAEVTIPRLEGPGGEMSVELHRGPLIEAADSQYDALVRLVQRLVNDGEPPTVLLSSHGARLPKLDERITRATGAEVIVLDRDAPVRGALLGRSAVETSVGELANDETLPYVVRLPTEVEKSGPIVHLRESQTGSFKARPPSEADRIAADPPPTHILYRGMAYPIGDGPFALGTQPAPGGRGLVLTGSTAGISRRHLLLDQADGRLRLKDLSTYGTWVDGQRVDGEVYLESGARIRLGSPGIEVQAIRVSAPPTGDGHGSAT